MIIVHEDKSRNRIYILIHPVFINVLTNKLQTSEANVFAAKLLVFNVPPLLLRSFVGNVEVNQPFQIAPEEASIAHFSALALTAFIVSSFYIRNYKPKAS